ncbi:hypothetical protein KAS08_00810 [Candidatus Pacearchaeota archaeon]|nr:hypothetical protein [Candidatus Pacearchaeota archaeon]
MDIEFTGQLIDSMSEAVLKLEKAQKKKKKDDTVKLKTFIFDLHRQVNDSLGGQNV